mgnify:CR=1 FL=1
MKELLLHARNASAAIIVQTRTNYDGVYMAMDAVQRAGSVTDTRKIRDAMAEMKGFNGVCGTFSFDAKRDPVVDLVLLKMEDGVFLAAGKQSS